MQETELLGNYQQILTAKWPGYYTYTKLYNSCASSINILDYCAEVWGFQDFREIDYVQNKAIRICLGVHRFAPLNAINCDMGWSASDVSRKVVMCRFWNRIIAMEDNRLPKIILNWAVNLKYVNTWSNNMKEVLYELSIKNNSDNREPVIINSAHD